MDEIKYFTFKELTNLTEVGDNSVVDKSLMQTVNDLAKANIAIDYIDFQKRDLWQDLFDKDNRLSLFDDLVSVFNRYVMDSDYELADNKGWANLEISKWDTKDGNPHIFDFKLPFDCSEWITRCYECEGRD